MPNLSSSLLGLGSRSRTSSPAPTSPPAATTMSNGPFASSLSSKGPSSLALASSSTMSAGVSSLATTSYSFKPYFTSTVEQLLEKNNQGLLPILLYIRNFNEYRRRPAEARLATRRAARAEAREIRLREVERQKKEMEETSDRHYELMNSAGSGSSGYESYGGAGGGVGLARMASISTTARNTPTMLNRESRTGSYTSSRRSSQDSLDFAGSNVADTARELRHQVHEFQEKFRDAMINNAQLDNEKQSYVYQIDLYKDELEEMEENYIRLNRDHKDKSKNYDQMKRDYDRVRSEFEMYKAALEERDRLIIDAGLVLIRNESDKKIRLCSQKVLSNGTALVNGDGKLMNGNLEDVEDGETEDAPNTEDASVLQLSNNISLISKQAAEMLREVPGSTLEKKLATILGQNKALASEVKEVAGELEEERARFREIGNSTNSTASHLSSEMEAEIQREVNKITNDLRYKLKKAESEIQALTANVSRLDTQVARYKTIADECEREADEQKSDKRKAQRELRDAQTRIDELESANSHLQKRIDKLKSSRFLPSGPASATNSVPTTPLLAQSATSNGPPSFPTNGTATGASSSSEDQSYCSSEASSTIASND